MESTHMYLIENTNFRASLRAHHSGNDKIEENKTSINRAGEGG